MQQPDFGNPPPVEYPTGTARTWIIGAALVALFLGAVDALVMSAAMPPAPRKYYKIIAVPIILTLLEKEFCLIL